MGDIQLAKRLLATHLFENISLLKMLETYGDKLAVWLIRREERWGVLIVLPAKISAFDHMSYPEAESVIFVSGSDLDLIRRLVEELPRDKPLVFKVQRAEYKTILESQFPLVRKKAFYTFTCEHLLEIPHQGNVAVHDTIDDHVLPLWMENGYSLREIQNYFAKGAKAYALYCHGSPISTCLAFMNYRNIWEVGAVHTIAEYRRKGYAKIVVSAAIDDLLRRGCLPRYQVEETNTNSIRLAESLGLKKVVTLEHLYFEG